MINSAEYKTRRNELMRQIGNGHVGIVLAAPEVIRNQDSHYRYRQNSNFYYLTGFSEPEAVAVFIPGRS
ncbi:MAG: aminopeptidase P N-terminal domain-containing protein, partial [Proteobacteria bacterium]|nr:aminopeptidase P N-terminal domain-containing protein [Pseudomonadota bacterium]